MEQIESSPKKPKDKSGYKVVIGVIIIKTFVHSITTVYGLLFQPFFKSLRSTEVEVSIVNNLCVALSNFSGILAGFMMKKISTKSVAISGCLCVTIGLVTTSFAKSLNIVLITYSAIVGIGLGLVVPACFIAVIDSFPTGRNQAVGVSMTGAMSGEIALPQIVSYFLVKTGFSETVALIGLLVFLGSFGALLLPDTVNSSRRFSDEAKLLISKERDMTLTQKIAKFVDLDILKDKSFLVLIIGMSCGHAVAADFGMIFPSFLKDAKKLNEFEVADCISVHAAADLFSQLTFHFYTDKLNISNKNCYLAGIIGSSFARFMLLKADSFYALLVISTILGYFKALIVTNYILVIAEYCSRKCPEKLPSAVSYNMITTGLAVLTQGQFLSWIRGEFGSYAVSFCAQNFFIYLVYVVWSIL